ncbi:hypothetical protein KHA80_00145 [Anaerobacillus sp. HL2]|nr:hypothetical protein KHA80_00145 [Anaerobacillus sp. HL2]
MNVWLNLTNNDVPRKEKRYLSERGEVEGIDKKLINKMFRNEVRDVSPFKVLDWLYELYGSNEEAWQKKYF